MDYNATLNERRKSRGSRKVVGALFFALNLILCIREKNLGKKKKKKPLPWRSLYARLYRITNIRALETIIFAEFYTSADVGISIPRNPSGSVADEMIDY